jgi:hypothetical protein
MARSAHEHDPPIGDEPAPEAAEAALKERLGDEQAHLIEFVKLGLATETFIEKNPVGRYLVKDAYSDLSEALKALLDMDSLDDTKARALFMQAKVARAMLTKIDQAITAGLEAERAIEGQDEATQ